MNRTPIVTSAIIVAALSLAVVPAGAQGRRDSGHQRGGERAAQSAPAPRQSGGERQAVPRSSDSRQPSNGPAISRGIGSSQSSGQQAISRGGGSRQPSAQQTMSRGGGSRQPSGGQAMSRGGGSRQPSGGQAMSRGYGSGQVEQRAMPRSNDRFQSPGYRSEGRFGYAQPRGGSGREYSRGYARPRDFVPYRPFYFSRPYYSFRARLDFGFGLWLGYSVPYPWSWYGNYRPRVYGYGYYNPGNYYYAEPEAQAYGGLSFDIQPSDADLYVDGEYVGPVGTFTPYGEPLTLVPGVHRIAIVRDGYRTMEWDVTIEPGQVLPYRGEMEPW